MPSKLVASLMAEVVVMHKKLDEHLSEGVGVKRDIEWLKKLLLIIIVGLVSLWFKK